MATKFLDKTGLSHFWSKIKAWCNATFAAITHSHAWSTITGKPTTISGYDITDAKISSGTITLGPNSITPLTSHQTLPTLSRTISGSGNAITDITVSGHAITATKGVTFLTSHQTLPTLSLTTSGSGNAITALSVSNHAITATKGATYITSSGSITGNAGTATKLATARSISAGDLEFQGSANFDGSGNINLNITQHRSIVNVGNKNNYPFHRIAYTAIETGNYIDRAITFFVGREHISAGYGICRIVLRTNNASGGGTAQCEVQWLARTSDIPVDTIQVGFNNTAAASYVDVFYKSSGIYNSAICRVMSHANSRNNVAQGFTVVSASTEASNTTASDPLTSTESYATIAAAGTKIRGKAYTSTIAASDSGVVGSANSCSGNAATVSGTAGTSTLAWNSEVTLYTVGGHAIKAKLPANPNSDTLMTQNKSTTNATYPVLLCPTADANANQGAKTGIFCAGVKVNASTGNIYTAGNMECSNSTPNYFAKITNLTRATAPSANHYVNSFCFVDSVGSKFGGIEHAYLTNRDNCIYFIVYNGTNTGDGHIYLGCGYDSSGNGYTVASLKPALTDSSSKIARTDWVREATGNFACNAATATQFSANKSVTLTGDVTGTASSKAGWSIATTLANSGVTANTYGNTSQQTPSHGGTFNIPYVTVDAKGRVTAAGTTTVKLPADNNTDTLVTQNVSTTNSTYPLLLCPTANATANQGAKTAIFPKSVKVNASTNELYATKLHSADAKVISSNGLYDTTNTGSLFVCGGSSINTSSHIKINGYQASSFSFMLRALSPTSTSTYADLVLDYGGTLKWKGQTVQTSSDERLKTPISSVDDDVLDAWADVSWGQFKFLDAVEEKGDNARFHVGLIAQGVDRTCIAKNIDIRKYGILCHDEWEDEYVEEDGKQVLYNKAGDIWMVRYTEALCMEAAYQRRKNKILENRISELETQVQNMLQVLENLKGA